MTQYNTSQKQLLIEFMSKHSDKSLSIDEWISFMNTDIENQKIPVRSTIYRLMQKLVNDKIVIRAHTSPKDVKYCIANCCGSHEHLHLKCVSCGSISHIDSDISCKFLNKISKKYNFKVNLVDTIMYGKCNNCK